MANCNSCNGGCQTGTRVGALNSLCRTGCRYPYYTGPCPPAPCNDGCGHSCSSCNQCNHCHRCRCNATVTDPEDGCGCNNCNHCGSCNSCTTCNHCSHRPCDNTSCNADCCEWPNLNGGCTHHGVFTAGGPLNLSAGSAVNFENHGGETHCFGNSYGSILIRHPGLYFVAVTVDIPKNADVDTVMRFELDGRAITPPEIAVCAGCGGCASNFCGHAIIQACAGSLLKLVTLREFFIECTTAQPVFTVTLFRIC